MKIKINFLIIIIAVVSCKEQTDISLGEKYKLVNSASMNDLIIVDTNNIVIINGHILDYAFDSIFIIAVQRPRDSVAGLQTMTFKESKEAFKNSNFKQYWIIDKTKGPVFSQGSKSYSNVYGPFKKENYNHKRYELEVQKVLQLKNKV